MQRFVLWTALASVVLCALMISSLRLGSVELSWRQVISALGLSSAPIPEILKTIVIDLRLPRSLLAALTGAGLAIAGLLLQTTTRNELADPFLFGLSSGASAGADNIPPMKAETGSVNAPSISPKRVITST
ncbi:iron chelate uptake ABC transporter family permease subunit, partial [Klebsiella aerogenes]|uniref:iron chelate uptake ABC transporter family permease subunit n=1 Tax=Klebsiella aerogenes TaxID=548 RepID=UPI001D0D2C8E